MKKISKSNKFVKYSVLMENPSLVDHLPETMEFTSYNFWQMLHKYKQVIVKPCKGFGGRKMFKVSMLDNGLFLIHNLKKKQTVHRHALDHFLQEKVLSKSKPFLVQYYIPLANANGKLVDFRYIVQRKRETRDWLITGKHGKIAEKGNVVTNLQRGADAVTVEEALKQCQFTKKQIQRIISDMDRITTEATQHLKKYYRNRTIWGFDYGVDIHGHVWIIEVNALPLTGGFRFLEDQSMYETIEKIKEFNLEWKERRKKELREKKEREERENQANEKKNRKD